MNDIETRISNLESSPKIETDSTEVTSEVEIIQNTIPLQSIQGFNKFEEKMEKDVHFYNQVVGVFKQNLIIEYLFNFNFVLQVRFMKNIGSNNCTAATFTQHILGRFISDDVAQKFNVQGTLRRKTDNAGQPVEKKQAFKDSHLFKALIGKFHRVEMKYFNLPNL